MERTKLTAGSSMRSWSGFATPPGRTKASKSSALTSDVVPIDVELVALVQMVHRLDLAGVRGDQSGEPPASSTAFHGSVNSTSSIPSFATMNATHDATEFVRRHVVASLSARRLPMRLFLCGYPMAGSRNARSWGADAR